MCFLYDISAFVVFFNLYFLLQMDHTISYTKNGVNLGVAFRDVKGDFALVGSCLVVPSYFSAFYKLVFQMSIVSKMGLNSFSLGAV